MTRAFYAEIWCLTEEGLLQTRGGMVVPPSSIDASNLFYRRALVETRGDLTVDVICEQIWNEWQNLDADHLTPDGGRSLMMGDMLRLFSSSWREWRRCAMMGWDRLTSEPVWAPPTSTEFVRYLTSGRRRVVLEEDNG